jgi:hypothetical protein
MYPGRPLTVFDGEKVHRSLLGTIDAQDRASTYWQRWSPRSCVSRDSHLRGPAQDML